MDSSTYSNCTFYACTSSTSTYTTGWDNRTRQAAILKKHEAAAVGRAQAVLLEHLTDAQRETFEKNRWFIVEGGRSGKKYRVEDDGCLVANIAVLDGEKVKHRLCGHCDLSAVPIGDHLLAQKLMLEHAEDEFIRIANRHAA